MAIEFTLPVPVGQESKFEQTLRRLKASGLKIKRTEHHHSPFTISDGKRDVVTHYRSFEYKGEATVESGSDIYLNAAGGISLNGNRPNGDIPASRSGVFSIDGEKPKKYLSGDSNLDKLFLAVNKLNKDVFMPEYKLSNGARACDKKDFIKAASQILSRFHARVDEHLTVDKTSFAAYCLAANKTPNSHRVNAWVQEVKDKDPDTVSPDVMEDNILASFKGTSLEGKLNTILSKDYITINESDLVTKAVESQILGSSLKVDKSMVNEFIPVNPNDVHFTGVVVETGIHPSSVKQKEQYFIRFATTNNELIEVVSGTDVRIPKDLVVDSASNQTPITIVGEFIRTSPELKIGENVMAPAISTVKMTGYTSETSSDLKDTIKVVNRVRL